MSQWIETIALKEGVLKNILWHQQRMELTLVAHESSFFVDLFILLSKYDLPQNGYYKVRVLYNTRQVLDVNWQLYTPRQLNTFELVDGTHIDYSYKDANRTQLEELKEESKEDEIIIVQKNCITDTSFTNLVFQQGEYWYTPASYLLNGTQRQYLLAENLITQREITRTDLSLYSHFKLINAMLPFEIAPTYSINQIKNRWD